MGLLKLAACLAAIDFIEELILQDSEVEIPIASSCSDGSVALDWKTLGVVLFIFNPDDIYFVTKNTREHKSKEKCIDFVILFTNLKRLNG